MILICGDTIDFFWSPLEEAKFASINQFISAFLITFMKVFGDAWVAQRLSISLQPRSWCRGPGIKSCIRFPQGACFSLCPCLCVSHKTNKQTNKHLLLEPLSQMTSKFQPHWNTHFSPCSLLPGFGTGSLPFLKVLHPLFTCQSPSRSSRPSSNVINTLIPHLSSRIEWIPSSSMFL